MSTTITDVTASLGRGNFEADTYAAQSAPAGVLMHPNPNPDAPIKHQLLRPSARVAALMMGRKKFEKTTIGLTLEPDFKGEAFVRITGGPAELTVTNDGDTVPTVLFDRFADIAHRAGGNQMIAATMEERYGNRSFTLVTVEHKGRHYLQIERTHVRPDGSITWTPISKLFRFCGVVLLDATSLRQAVAGLNAALDASEITKAPYYL